MINYSIVMRSVNANLFEINQAKSRIKAAEKAGVSPAQEDLDLVATEKQNAFAVAQYADVMTIDKLAKHIASHGCVYSRADINAILNMTVDCTRELLLEGKKIRLGDLGDFSVSLVSKGAESADKFTSQNITAVNVVWDCGSEFKNLIGEAEFNLVASRKAQEAVIKAIKEGKTIVDLNKPAASDNDGDGDNPNGNDNGNDNGGGGGGTPKYTLTVKANNDNYGTVEGGGEYAENASATLKAVAKNGYEFKQWNDGNTASTRVVTVVADKTYTATFSQRQSDEEGTI